MTLASSRSAIPPSRRNRPTFLFCFRHGTDRINDIAQRVVSALEQNQIRAVNGGAAGFPMEADRWSGKMWLISHKPVAVAAGLVRSSVN